jgi:putative transposase
MPSTHHGILLHFVFSTKNRVPLIDEHWQDELFAYVGATAREHKATVLCSGGTEDHVYLLAKVHPSYAIADTVQLIKANASRWINLEHRTNSRFEWQRGYGVFSVSQSQAEKVKHYIQNQRQHHRRLTFRDEYLAILRRHAIEFDERFVFDEEIIG